jgi:SAM-dependent methyltransferase
MNTFEQFITEAQNQPFAGWDFAFLKGRWKEAALSWDYRSIVLEKLPGVTSLLDMGTGGGEFLSSLRPLPADTCATEAYPPNIPIARGRLEPLGIPVFAVESDDALPLEDARFELVINRHEAFSAREVYRILKPGGTFITQQVGGDDNRRINEALGDQTPAPYAGWSLAKAAAELGAAGFAIVRQGEEYPETEFQDVGALVYYLKAIPWQVPDFSVERYHDQLRAIHERIQASGPLKVYSHRFWLEARKP